MKRKRLHILPLAVLVCVSFMRGTCATTTNDPELSTQSMNYYIGLGGNAKAKEKLLSIIGSAKTEVVGVFNDLADTDISSALIEKANAGLKVAVGGDRRNENNAGFAALKSLRSSNKFLDYATATSSAAAEPNQNLKNKILATRLNFNRLNRSLKYNAEPFDGRVEYNFVVADKYNCWVSTGGANSETFSTGFSIVFVFQSFDICNDFYNEAQQLVYGGLFGDEGVPSFGKFRNSKTITDPNTRFRLGDLIFNIYFAPQERPLVALVTELLRAEKNIKFASRAITQDIVADMTNHNSNRSHVLNALQYKARIPQVFGQPFSIKGVMGTEVDGAPTAIPSPWTSYTAPYNALVSGSCPTVNTTTLNIPFKDTNGTAVFNNAKINTTSIHCDLKALQDAIGSTSTAEFRKHPSSLPFSVFMTDVGARKPRLIVMSSDLRKRYYYDDGQSQDAEPKRTQDDLYSITDAFVIMVEPAGTEANMKIFNDFSTLVDRLFNAGGAL